MTIKVPRDAEGGKAAAQTAVGGVRSLKWLMLLLIVAVVVAMMCVMRNVNVGEAIVDMDEVFVKPSPPATESSAEKSEKTSPQLSVKQTNRKPEKRPPAPPTPAAPSPSPSPPELLRAGAAWVWGEWVAPARFHPTHVQPVDGWRLDLPWMPLEAPGSDPPAFHDFTREEAALCLAHTSGGGDTPITLVGDSYMRGLYVSLVERVTGAERSQDVFSGTLVERRKQLQAVALPTDLPIGLTVLSPDGFSLRKHLEFVREAVPRLNRAGAVVMNAYLHDTNSAVVKRVGVAATGREYLENVEKLGALASAENLPLIWVSGISYSKRASPPQRPDRARVLNAGAISALRAVHGATRFVDAFHVTQSCVWANCTTVGSHMPPQFNRAKADLLLNVLCDEGVRRAASRNSELAKSVRAALRQLDVAAKHDFRRAGDAWVWGEWTPPSRFRATLLQPLDGWTASAPWLPVPRGLDSYRIFDVQETVACISRVTENGARPLVLVGSSYMRNLYVALVDLLTGCEDTEYLFHGSAEERVEALRAKKVPAGMPVRVDIISPPFFALRDHSDLLQRSMPDLRAASFVVMEALIHDVKRDVVTELGEERTVREYRENVDAWAREVARNALSLVWVAGPSYHAEQVPKKYRAAQATDRMHQLNAEAIVRIRSVAPHTRFFDVFHFSQACAWSNCTMDGGHLTRPMNRMKAQILLNMLC